MVGTFSNRSPTTEPVVPSTGCVAGIGGMGRALLEAAEPCLGRRTDGAAMAATGASAGYGAICGASLAAAAVAEAAPAGAAARGPFRREIGGDAGNGRHARGPVSAPSIGPVIYAFPPSAASPIRSLRLSGRGSRRP